MLFKVSTLSEAFVTNLTGVWLFSGMYFHVSIKILFPGGFMAANFAFVGFDVLVHIFVLFEFVFVLENFRAEGAFESLS